MIAGCMRAAAVVSDTVADPWATRTTAATRKLATMSGRCIESIAWAIASPIPEDRSTPPNMPPAPVMRMTEQTGPSAESVTSSVSVPPLLRARPRTTIAMMVVMSSATGVSPIIRRICTHIASPSTVPAVDSELRTVFIAMRTSGNRRRNTTSHGLGLDLKSLSRSPSPSVPRIVGTGTETFFVSGFVMRRPPKYHAGMTKTRPSSTMSPWSAP